MRPQKGGYLFPAKRVKAPQRGLFLEHLADESYLKFGLQTARERTQPSDPVAEVFSLDKKANDDELQPPPAGAGRPSHEQANPEVSA